MHEVPLQECLEVMHNLSLDQEVRHTSTEPIQTSQQQETVTVNPCEIAQEMIQTVESVEERPPKPQSEVL